MQYRGYMATGVSRDLHATPNNMDAGVYADV
jgi:hypothetical protein